MFKSSKIFLAFLLFTLFVALASAAATPAYDSDLVLLTEAEALDGSEFDLDKRDPKGGSGGGKGGGGGRAVASGGGTKNNTAGALLPCLIKAGMTTLGFGVAAAWYQL